MGNLRDLSDILHRCTSLSSADAYPETLWFHKDPRVGATAAVTVAGQWSTLFLYNGRDAGATYTSFPPLNNTTANPGSLGQVNPYLTQWMISVNACSSTTGNLVLFDRLGYYSTLSGNTGSVQTFSSALTPNRYTGTESVGNSIWIEIVTLIGATPRTVTVSYTNQDGTSGRTTVAANIGGTGLREIHRMIPLTLQSGDTGVRSVESMTLSAGTGTAGELAVVVNHQLVAVPIANPGVGTVIDMTAGLPGPVEIKHNAYISFGWHANGATAPMIFGNIQLVNA